MTLDWFLLLTPILLLPLLLLLSFTGCEGTVEYSYPELTFILHSSLLVPAPHVTHVQFRWTREQGGNVEEYPPVDVDEYAEIDGAPGEIIREFRYQVEKPEVGLWTVTCRPFVANIGSGEATCGPFELFSPTGKISIKFEIVLDPQGEWGRVQVSEGGCPSSS